MERFVKGDVVVVPFPFSDLSEAKRRPAVVVSVLKGSDLILCQITSRNVRDDYSIPLNDKDFKEGGLKQPSNARPNRVFTADRNIVLYRAGLLVKTKIDAIVEKMVEILRSQ